MTPVSHTRTHAHTWPAARRHPLWLLGRTRRGKGKTEPAVRRLPRRSPRQAQPWGSRSQPFPDLGESVWGPHVWHLPAAPGPWAHLATALMSRPAGTSSPQGPEAASGGREATHVVLWEDPGPWGARLQGHTSGHGPRRRLPLTTAQTGCIQPRAGSAELLNPEGLRPERRPAPQRARGPASQTPL